MSLRQGNLSYLKTVIILNDKKRVQGALLLRAILFLALHLHAHILMYLCAQTQFHVHTYSTHNPQRFCVIDSAEHQIAHCDK